MKPFLASLCLLGLFLTQCRSEFNLKGDFIIGGLFGIHDASDTVHHDRPEAINCSSHQFSASNYRRFQLMRFSVEEINNSTSLLPNVSLGYEMFDHCSDALSFPGVFRLMSVNGSIQPWAEPNDKVYKVIAVIGPFTSTEAMTVAPFFMPDLIPVVSYGSSSSIFSSKVKYPSFLRTGNPNKDVIDVIVTMVQHFNWSWVAFLNSDDAYANDGLELFMRKIKTTEICLAYTKSVNQNTDYSQIFKNIEDQRINVIIVFASEVAAEALIESAVQLNVTNKVWIAADTWSLNKRLLKMNGIRNIGTVLGLSQPALTIAGFSEFITSFETQSRYTENMPQKFCNQVSNWDTGRAKDILDADPSFSYPVYSAVYAIAHALHKVLQCGTAGCNNIIVYPNMVLAEIQKSNFTLLNRTVLFDENGVLRSGLFSLVFWNSSGDAEEVGLYSFYPTVTFFINISKINWHTDGEVPASVCSPECSKGYARIQNRIHKCCFTCEICPAGTYVNVEENPYKCVLCKSTEWSEEGSTSCNLRQLEYIQLTDTVAIAIMVTTWVIVGLTLSVSVLFSINYNTPVVRSAGGPMCFLILGCLGLCSISVFFHFGLPTPASCILRYFPFIWFYTVCLACFVVRSFQIVCIFKISAKFPSLLIWWKKYHGQWLLISAAFVVQAVLLLTFSYDPPRPYNETSWRPEQIVLFCYMNLKATSCSLVLPISFACLCFVFSYMAKDLPKNYNEAKGITFSLLLLTFTWTIFITVYMLYRGKYIQTLNAVTVLLSLYYFLVGYFLPKCYIILFQPNKNTQQYFQSLIQNYTKTISQ
ncbi:taste receptor, type 1, member 2b precursor [Oryzias latipes]|uniref:Taste receptor, type 1, member 2b n=1 Tax=Oryzias latipes TaxID=8090 RepID=Q2MHK4_ORYLA|nr:taste receptor, type 1, member 2b precursor [Oryzias latipes]BAE78483.2 taste receptor, type 1, member 2b [Oryzias latipes]